MLDLVKEQLNNSNPIQNSENSWPESLEVEKGDVAKNFENFVLNRKDYEIATAMDKWPPENEGYKVKIFMSALRNKALIKYYNRFQLTEQDSVKNIIEAIKKKLSSKKNVIYDRPMFNSCNQWKNETFDEYLLKLNKLVEKCEFNSFKDDLLRDKVVIGIKNKELQNKLMTKADLTLEKAIDSCKVEELTKKRMKDIQKKIKNILT